MTASSLDSPLAPDLLLHTDEEAVVIPDLTCASGECLSCAALLLLDAPTT